MMYFHGGHAGLHPGDAVIPSSRHVTDNCPICVARAAGKNCTVGEYRRWLLTMGQQAVPILMKLRGVPSHLPMDPPSEVSAVYVTSDENYAAFYAAVAKGDLYEVRPVGLLAASATDHFPTWTCDRAVVARVIRRRVVRSRRERRELERRWKKADDKAARLPRRDTGEER